MKAIYKQQLAREFQLGIASIQPIQPVAKVCMLYYIYSWFSLV